jgi:broad-specificity NMP kinase
MKRLAFFITGTSGSGKSTIVPILKKLLPEFSVYDFDEIGVPSGADQKWRQEASNKWLKIISKRKETKTIVCGVTVPDEIKSANKDKSFELYFASIDIDPKDVKERLLKRCWSKERIEDNILWGKVLKDKTEKESGSIIVDGSNNSPDEVVRILVNWIKGKL